MFKVAGCALGVALIMFVGGRPLQAQHHHHDDHGGHFDWHNGHLDWHEPGHFDWHNGHLDYHPGHVDHLHPWYHDTYYYPTAPAIVTRPAIVNPLPGPGVVTGYAPNNAPIAIVNPAELSTPVTFTLNSRSYTLQPGEQMDFTFDRSLVIEFHRGGDFGSARYSLRDGIFKFTAGANGWDIKRIRNDANSLPPSVPGGNQLPVPVPGQGQ
jgi:hypothetical protein